uniref:Uncharacterized protein n=1 Tax=Oscillatoriales cyanobacterium SpSt-402 TaxID=2282168 RepID=A0A832H172_9CYAN
MRNEILVGAIAIPAIAFGMPLSAQAQRLIPDQYIRQHLEDPNGIMKRSFIKVLAEGQEGKAVAMGNWQIIKVSPTSTVGLHYETGVMTVFDADPNRDGAIEDARFVVMQVFETICPQDVATNPRLAGLSPSFDALAVGVVQNGKTNIRTGTRVVKFKPGSVFDVFLCKGRK